MVQRILVDYLTVSVAMSAFSVADMVKIIGIKQEEYQIGSSRLGLHNCMYYGGIKIHYHQPEDLEVPRPLIVLELSGKGCRLLETLKEGTGFNWIDFIHQFLCTEFSHLARLDIACDDKQESDDEKPFLSFPVMVRHVKERRYVSQANRKIYTDGDEQQIVFGSPSSDRRLRIYNKALERGYDKHWIRVEFQLRDDSALSFYMRALEIADIGRAYYGILYAYLRFTREVNDTNHTERLTVCRWWQSFCNNAQKITGFYLGGLEYNKGNVQEYIRVQAASNIETWLRLHDGDIAPLFGLVEGVKLNKRQEFLLRVEELKEEIRRTYERVDTDE